MAHGAAGRALVARCRAVGWAGVALLVASLSAGPARADQTRIRIDLVSPRGIGATIGTIRAVDSKDGLRLTPLLKGLAPGPHGFQVHEHGDCRPAEVDGKTLAAGAAGNLFDPGETGEQEGSQGKARAGDLPDLTVGHDGIARTPVTAPRLRLSQIDRRALVIRTGGVAVACGVIE
jgi:Cu-Zn family superoxide dismutase